MLYAGISLFCISIPKGLPVGYLEIENQFCTLFCFTKLESVTKGILIKALQEQVCRQVDAEWKKPSDIRSQILLFFIARKILLIQL